MKIGLILAISAIGAGAVLVSSGCIVTASGPPVCIDDGHHGCDVDEDCCSLDFICDQGTCVQGACTADNLECAFDSDCCSGICYGDNFCGVPGCSDDNVPCAKDIE